MRRPEAAAARAAARAGLERGQAELGPRVAGLQLEARRLASGLLSGLHRSVHRGGAAEFAEYKEYAPGDEPRTIDWKCVARTDKWFVKRYEDLTSRRAQLLLDCSASMAFSRGGRPSKLDLSRVVLAALASLLLRQGDAAGVSLWVGQADVGVPPRARGPQLDALLTLLVLAEASGGTQLPAMLDAASARLPRRSLVILASDLIDDLAAVAAALRRLASRGHEIVVLQVLDQDEIAFPFLGTLRFRDPETGDEVTADAPSVADGYRREATAFLEACERHCVASRADLVRLTNGEDPARPLLRFLARRRSLARRLMSQG